ncbi:Cilia- and flagella-associated protein 36 (Coiled-coil domain-containing protein 104) [Durusdinium trenchii]|uniref:Cilia- and flagella-associated protein 36 n=2 Tax=Durusdinium trenchii TaxID=1381693 RepID=A0ABP0PTW9_9DINO
MTTPLRWMGNISIFAQYLTWSGLAADLQQLHGLQVSKLSMSELSHDERELVLQVKTWFTCTEMEALVQTAVQFADANCAIFEPELGEHKLVYTQLHNEFKQLFEDRLNSFLASIGATPEAFYAAFEKAGHEGEVQTMAELMYTCLEYEFFCQIMCERKRELEAQHATGVLPQPHAPGISGYGGHKDGYSGPGAPSAA